MRGADTRQLLMRIQRTLAPGGRYSDVVAVDEGPIRWLYIAGQTARGDDVPDEVGAQAEICLSQLHELLAQWGAGVGDVVRMTTYLSDLSDYSAFADARARCFGSAPPASTAVEVSGLLDDRVIEIDAVAVVARES